jgi:hypothetical protein
MKITLRLINGVLVPHGEKDKKPLEGFTDGALFVVDMKNIDIRTVKQNRALHQYFRLICEKLNEKGLTVVKTLKVDVDWTPLTVKECLWRPVQEAVLRKKSTTELKRDELDKVYDNLNRALAIKFGISVPFPTEELL